MIEIIGTIIVAIIFSLALLIGTIVVVKNRCYDLLFAVWSIGSEIAIITITTIGIYSFLR